MTELTDEQGAAIEADIRRSLDEPMPQPLRRALGALIEPHTINMYIKHRDVMECIDVAFPVIMDYLRQHGTA